MKDLALFIIILFFTTRLTSQEFLVNDSNGGLTKLDVNGCIVDNIGYIGFFTDLAAHPDGFMYAIQSDGSLHRFKIPGTTTSEVAKFDGNLYYALTATADGVIYAASESGQLRSFQPSTGKVIEYSNIGFGAAGDLTFYKGQLYMASTDNTMVTVHPNNPDLNEIVIDFSEEGVEIFGIVSTLYECQIRTYAISGDINSRIFEIGWENGTFVESCTADLRIYGGSSEFEFKASNEVLYIDQYSRLNSSCEIADITVSIAGKGLGSTIEYSLDNQNFQLSPNFEGLPFGKHLIYMRDELGCESVDSILLEPGVLEVDLLGTENATCGLENGIAVLAIQSNADSFEVKGYGQTEQLSYLGQGEYTVFIADTDGCKDSLQFSIGQIVGAAITNLRVLPATCGDHNGALTVEVDKNQVTFDVNDIRSTSGVIEGLAPDLYLLQITDRDGCVIDTSFSVIESDQCDLFIPNVFSPNADGFNDMFEVFSPAAKNIISVVIYDRWGSVVYEKKGGYPKWDGTNEGSRVAEDIYTYVLTLQGNARQILLNGSILLVR